MASSQVPADWRSANVTPVFKKGSKSLPANYRPISITSTVCRLMEKLVKGKLCAFLREHSVITDHQHGFLSQHSTVTQLLECLNDWTVALDSAQPVDVAYLDIAKAFDSVSHKKLIEKLKYYGISGRLVDWVEAWLSDRCQRVRVNDSYSSSSPVQSGVPQGSCLGPLLFLLYINDLPQVIREAKLSLFADDCKLYFFARHTHQRTVLQEALSAVMTWCDRNQLVLALAKCSILHLGPRSNPRESYSVDGVVLPSHTCVRDLGVLVSSDLRFSEHCSNIAQLASTKVNMIFNCFLNRKTTFLVHLYKTYVRSRLEYASQVWNPSLERNIRVLESVQRQFTRRLPGLASLSYPERLILTGLESLELRRLQADLIMVYKIIHRLVDLRFEDYFQYCQNRSSRGHRFKLTVAKSNTICRANFFSCRVVSVWNSLLQITVNSATLNTFKNRLSKENLGNFLQVRL